MSITTHLQLNINTLGFCKIFPRPVVAPELSEVHVEGEVHELLGEVADAEDVERDPDSDRGPWAAPSRDSCQY